MVKISFSCKTRTRYEWHSTFEDATGARLQKIWTSWNGRGESDAVGVLG